MTHFFASNVCIVADGRMLRNPLRSPSVASCMAPLAWRRVGCTKQTPAASFIDLLGNASQSGFLPHGETLPFWVEIDFHGGAWLRPRRVCHIPLFHKEPRPW
jgi:hypothetical protein